MVVPALQLPNFSRPHRIKKQYRSGRINIKTDTKVLLVDLNNFARYPTLPIGYLAAILRNASVEVDVFAPLMVGIPGLVREARPHFFSLLASKLNHRAATSSNRLVRSARTRLAKRQAGGINAHHHAVFEGFRAHLDAAKPHAVMISTYLMYRDVCEQICSMCRERGIPVLIGGPYFVEAEVIAQWVKIPGLSGLVAGEVELELPSILETLLSHGDLSKHVGIMVAQNSGKPRGQIAPPLPDLNLVPVPDYSDFPWDRYPNRIVPVITGRGCGWGVCSFCSDVTSSAGRTYRSRSSENVLAELRHHNTQHQASRFVFTDLKLNSNVEVWRSIISGMQAVAPGGEWIGSVHVGMEDDNGLSEADLRSAAASGCVRLTTGLETGSQRVADLMKKGTRLDAISSFLKSASAAGISCRCTMILGYPGETAEDVQASVEFLANHTREIERVSLNRLQIIAGTTLHRSLKTAPHKFKNITILQEDGAMAQVKHHNNVVGTLKHRRAVMRLLTEVHRINARDLSLRAREFEGVM